MISRWCLFALVILFVSLNAFAHENEEDLESVYPLFTRLGCVKANQSQIAIIDQGNAKKDLFLRQCAQATRNSAWCEQLVRPNPDSLAMFQCTYGNSQVHQLIQPEEGTWKNAFAAVVLVEQLQNEGYKVCEIYNWWRPEPYNRNVGGAPGRHPYGTSVDVRFCDKQNQEKAFLRLCELRKAGRLRALGFYPSAALHFGIGDARANTWGKTCP